MTSVEIICWYESGLRFTVRIVDLETSTTFMLEPGANSSSFVFPSIRYLS